MLVVLASVVMAVAACDDTTTVAPPDKPPQIKTLKSYTKTSDGKGLPSNDVYSFLTVSNGEFWIGTAAGIARYPDVSSTVRKGDVVNAVNGLPNPKVTCMVEYAGKVYAATWGGGIGVYDIAGNSWTQIVVTASGLQSPYVADIAVSPTPTEKKLYFATNDGVTIYDPAGNTFTHFTDDLIDKIVSSVEVTETEGVVQRWYGPRVDAKLAESEFALHGITVSKGASAVYEYKTTNSGLVEPNVNDLYYDTVDSLYWVSYSTTGMSAVDVTAKTWTNHTFVDGLPSNTVFSVTRAANTIWAGTQGGLAKHLPNGKWQGYAQSGGLQANRVRRVYSDDGSRLWVGFVEGGAARVQP